MAEPKAPQILANRSQLASAVVSLRDGGMGPWVAAEKTFDVAPGGSTQFTFAVTDAADGRHAVVLDRLDTLNPGIYEPRLYSPDADWSTVSGREPDHRYLFG